MSLVIERYFIGNDEFLSVSHYFEQNGDLIPDPDVLFVNGIPVELTRVFVYTKVNSRNRKEVESLLGMWARNIREQGFLEKVKK